MREDPTFLQIYYAALDMVNFSNVRSHSHMITHSLRNVSSQDVLSYKVERAQGLAGCNVVTVLMHNNGFSLQEAADYSGVMYQKLMQQMLQGKASLRSFGPVVDGQLQKYIKGLEDWVMGSLNWSLESKRYFSDGVDQIRLTREVRL